MSEFTPEDFVDPDADRLRTTPLDALHRRLGARMVPFAGYELPVQYPAGVLAEHTQCRERAALFDVSHMGQISLRGADAAAALETLVPGDMLGIAPGRQRYTLFLDEAGGILDDLMVANHGERLLLIVNASRKDADSQHLATRIPQVHAERHDDRALLALQGPAAGASWPGCRPPPRRCGSWVWPRWTSPASPSGSAAPATRGRTGSRSRSPARTPRRWPSGCWPSRRWRPPGWARATACGWRPGCACMATTSTS